MDLFRDPGEELLGELKTVDPDRITPIDALQKLKELKDRFSG